MTIEKHVNLQTDEVCYMLKYKGIELAAYEPNQFITVSRRVWEKSQKISDLLMYLSEIAESIENLEKSKKKGKRE